jgi:molecular chaperone DnaJ
MRFQRGVSYYEDLQVDENASFDDIKKQFRKLAMQHHPDKGGDTEEFQRINRAYETLSDAEKRQQYDSELRNPFAGQQAHRDPFSAFGSMFGGNPFGGGGHPFGGFGGGGMPDIHAFFQQMNINVNRPRRQMPDKQAVLPISITVALQGVHTVMVQDMTRHCPECTAKCPECEGQGITIQRLINHMFPHQHMAQQIQCERCQGTGIVQAKSDCDERKCKRGKLTEQIAATVKVHAKDCKNAEVVFDKLGVQAERWLDDAGKFRVRIDIQKPADVTIDSTSGDITFTPSVSVVDAIVGTEIQLPLELSSNTVPQPTTSVKIPPCVLFNPSFVYCFTGCGLVINEDMTRAHMRVIPKIDFSTPATIEIVQNNEQFVDLRVFLSSTKCETETEHHKEET